MKLLAAMNESLRRCTVCGELKGHEDGLVCDNHHFVCAGEDCRFIGFFRDIRRAACPECGQLLQPSEWWCG
jgi:hypothetical protein